MEIKRPWATGPVYEKEAVMNHPYVASDGPITPLVMGSPDAQDRAPGMRGGALSALTDKILTPYLFPTETSQEKTTRTLRKEPSSGRDWEILTALARAVDASSPWTADHSERVAHLAVQIGSVLGLSPYDLDILHRAALLHDIGKIGVAGTILDKSERLTHEESRSIAEHPRIGARILEPIRAYGAMIPMVLQHHEQFSGAGYPNGLAGEAICLGARILAVADVYDALVSERPYRRGWKQEDAMTFISIRHPSQFDPSVVQAFLEVMTEREPVPQKSLDIPPPPSRHSFGKPSPDLHL